MAKILIADDEPKLGRVLSEMLEAQGDEVERVQGGKAALDRIAAARFDLVITDLRMPDVDGLTVLQEARRIAPTMDVILMTAYASTDTAVEALRRGASDYLIKPFSMDELRIRVRRLTDKRALEGRTRDLQSQLGGGPRFEGIIGGSARMREVLEQIAQVARTDATVLLLGPSGTGKTLLARAIHYRSARADGPLVEAHCAAVPETLLESELFGHEKGAFTGAIEARRGQVEVAARGTLFLDEIGEVSTAIQVKLLRFLQDREFLRVGSAKVQRVDVRLIAATNRDLAAAVKDGSFREDFFYRLNVFPIQVPPLRDRAEDIPALVAHTLTRRGVDPARLEDEALDALTAYAWPGNIRELENVIERAVILAADGPIARRHLPRALVETPAAVTPVMLLRPGFSLDQLERDVIHQALAQAAGNKTEAARLLGITRRRLYSRLKSMETPLDPPHALPDDD